VFVFVLSVIAVSNPGQIRVKSRYDTLKSVCLLVISPKIERDGSFFDRLIGAMTFEILQMVLKVAVGDSV